MEDPTKERETPIVEQEVTISETFHKSVKLDTRDYVFNGVYRNDEGNKEIDTDFSYTNWLNEYKNNGHYTLEELMAKTVVLLKALYPYAIKENQKEIKVLLNGFKDWYQDEIEVVL